MATQKEKIIFELAYYKLLNKNRYLSYIKKEYFTFKKGGIPNIERMFIIEIDNIIDNNDIMQIVENIRSRFFQIHNSPAPYISFLNVDRRRLNFIKQLFWDKKLKFVDGSHFDGDKFRIDDLMRTIHNQTSEQNFKIVSNEKLASVLKKQSFDNIFIFLTSGDLKWQKNIKLKKYKEFHINQTKDIIKIII